jgi:steroid 5-alpha reductase family enzyme
VYYAKAFGFIYIGQGIFSLINNSVVLYVNIFSNGKSIDIDGTKITPSLSVLDYVGAAIWLLGFIIEVMADRQLANHLARPKPGTGKFIKSGLWRYSRHPNYFGEAVMWWGIFIIAVNLHFGFIVVYSPIFITFFLRFVSGVPFPEKKYATNPEWMAYCKETNVFALWFYKTNPEQYDRNSKTMKLAEEQV